MAARRKIVWTAPALDELDEIAAYIALDKPLAAANLVRRCLVAVKQLGDHPASGRRLPESLAGPHREVIVGPCRIVYRAEASRVFIVAVIRGERLLRPEDLP